MENVDYFKLSDIELMRFYCNSISSPWNVTRESVKVGIPCRDGVAIMVREALYFISQGNMFMVNRTPSCPRSFLLRMFTLHRRSHVCVYN
jgi:hypothetical protein